MLTSDSRPPVGGQRAAERHARAPWLRRTGGALLTGAAAICLGLPGAATAATIPHGLGLIPSTPPTVSSPLAGADSLMTPASLPASVSLTANAMAVGNQGQIGSCAAWSTIYGALGYWKNEEHISGGGLAPMYTYSQVDGGVDEGSSIEGNLSVAASQGVDTQSDYWQGNFDYADQPTAAEKLNAVNWKLSTYSNLSVGESASSTVTQTSVETALAAGDPVVIGIPVYNNFEYLGSANSGYYASVSGPLDGYHAVVALGYNSQGLVIENSWGTGWANAGFATLAWPYVNQYVFDAVSVGPLVSTEPQATVLPTTGGTARVSYTSTATPGTWNATASDAYQWESAPSSSSDWTTIAGATSATYTPTSSLLGDQLRVVVTATGAHGTGSAASAATTVTNAVITAPVNTALPTVSGSTSTGSTLAATTGSWNPTPTGYTYQWQRSAGSNTSSWTNISGATSASYTLTSSDVGSADRVVVTATNSAGSTSATSTATGIVIGAPVNATAPTVTGTAKQGSVLTASTGSWSQTPTGYTYQWQRSAGSNTSSWTNIGGATSASYTLTLADVGSADRVVVTATNSAGSASAASAATSVVAVGVPANVTAPTITGTTVRGSVLSASPGTWSPTGTSYTYQWQRSAGSNTGNWTNVSGATSATYTLAAIDEGSALRVVVTATNSSGSTGATSTATSVISKSAPANTAVPTVSGTAAVGGTLTATSGNWSGVGNTYGYQWQRSTNGTTWTNIAPAVTNRYTLTQADAGDYVRVVVLAGNPDGSASANSAKLSVAKAAAARPAAVKAAIRAKKRKAAAAKAARRR